MVLTVRDFELAAGRTFSETKIAEQMHEIVAILEPTLTPRGIRQWFMARNRYLNGRQPVMALATGDFATVHEAASAFADGTYM